MEYYSETCIVTSENGADVVAVVDTFIQSDKLVVILNKSLRITLKWNGKLYVGGMAGLEFFSDGPKITTTRSRFK